MHGTHLAHPPSTRFGSSSSAVDGEPVPACRVAVFFLQATKNPPAHPSYGGFLFSVLNNIKSNPIMTDDFDSQQSPAEPFSSSQELLDALEPIVARCPLEWPPDEVAEDFLVLLQLRQLGAGVLHPEQIYPLLMKTVSPKKSAQLAAMPYQDFLRTCYWHDVRDYVLYRQKYQCQLCAATAGLQVHHRTYRHRGWEHHHLEDLIVLCRPCHQTFHDHREVNS